MRHSRVRARLADLLTSRLLSTRPLKRISARGRGSAALRVRSRSQIARNRADFDRLSETSEN
jgi:hypothetical protein